MNPILQRLTQNQRTNPINGLLKGDPNQMFNSMMQTNPQFAEFVRKNRGKTVEQIAKENGVDLGLIKNLLK